MQKKLNNFLVDSVGGRGLFKSNCSHIQKCFLEELIQSVYIEKIKVEENGILYTEPRQTKISCSLDWDMVIDGYAHNDGVKPIVFFIFVNSDTCDIHILKLFETVYEHWQSEFFQHTFDAKIDDVVPIFLNSTSEYNGTLHSIIYEILTHMDAINDAVNDASILPPIKDAYPIKDESRIQPPASKSDKPNFFQRIYQSMYPRPAGYNGDGQPPFNSNRGVAAATYDGDSDDGNSAAAATIDGDSDDGNSAQPPFMNNRGSAPRTYDGKTYDGNSAQPPFMNNRGGAYELYDGESAQPPFMNNRGGAPATNDGDSAPHNGEELPFFQPQKKPQVLKHTLLPQPQGSQSPPPQIIAQDTTQGNGGFGLKPPLQREPTVDLSQTIPRLMRDRTTHQQEEGLRGHQKMEVVNKQKERQKERKKLLEQLQNDTAQINQMKGSFVGNEY